MWKIRATPAVTILQFFAANAIFGFAVALFVEKTSTITQAFTTALVEVLLLIIQLVRQQLYYQQRRSP